MFSLGWEGCSCVQCKTVTQSERPQHCHSATMGSMGCEAGLRGSGVMRAEDSAAGQDEGEGAEVDPDYWRSAFATAQEWWCALRLG